MRVRRAVAAIVALASLFVPMTAGPAYADEEIRCEAIETVALPTQIPQTFGCDTFTFNSRCSLHIACIWTAKAHVEGAGVVGARVQLFTDVARGIDQGRCGFAAVECDAIARRQVRARCESATRCDSDENDAFFAVRIHIACDWQGLVAAAVKITCVLIGRTPLIL